jgi:hypothetical protein
MGPKALAGRARLGLGLGADWLMHAKFLHELCNLLMHIPTYYNVISCYNRVLY